MGLEDETRDDEKNILLELLHILEESKSPIGTNDFCERTNRSRASVIRALGYLLQGGQIKKVGSGKNIGYLLSPDKEEKPIYVSDFKNIMSPEELVLYLNHYQDRLSNTSVLCHYTSIRAVVGIISTRCWYLGSPQNMNDGLELQQTLQGRNDIFFSSFMAEQKESIAMWSMYAQPWSDGVMISIPVKDFKRWFREIKVVYAADAHTKKPMKDTRLSLDKLKLSLSRVAYVNGDANDMKSISCGYAKNDQLKNVYSPELAGYIKDEAWSYEKEIRLRCDLDETLHYKGVSIELPDDFIDTMVITKGPRFQGDLLERLKKEIDLNFHTESSLFYDKLKYTPCDNCALKR